MSACPPAGPPCLLSLYASALRTSATLHAGVSHVWEVRAFDPSTSTVDPTARVIVRGDWVAIGTTPALHVRLVNHARRPVLLGLSRVDGACAFNMQACLPPGAPAEVLLSGEDALAVVLSWSAPGAGGGADDLSDAPWRVDALNSHLLPL